MGWICKHCGTENDLNISTCIACSTAAEAAYLQSEAKADEREHRAYLRRIARKLSALMQDYRHLRRALMCLNALAVMLVVACAVHTATRPGMLEPRNAQLLFSSEAARHPGVARLLSQSEKLAGRADRALPELEGQRYALARNLASHTPPLSAEDASDRLSSALGRFTAPAADHLAALESSGTLLLSRAQGAGQWLEALQHFFAPTDDSSDITKESQSE